MNPVNLGRKDFAFLKSKKEKRSPEPAIANEELIIHTNEKEKGAAELIIANKELVFQNEQNEKRAAELVIANKEMAFQNDYHLSGIILNYVEP